MTKRKNVYVILNGLIVVLVLGCASPSKEKELISGVDYKLWRKVDPESEIRGTMTYYFFDTEGSYKLYKKYKNQREIVEFEMGDVLLIEKWRTIGNDSVSMGGKTYKIELLNDTNFSFSDSANKIMRLVYKNDRL